MKIVEMAECLSAFTAFITVCLASVELASRSKIKKADDAMEIYADYLHIRQQLDYVLGNVESFSNKCESMNRAEIISYAKAHIIERSLFDVVNKIEKNSICNFNYSSKKDELGKNNSKIILDFSGEATNFLVFINTLYQAIIENDDISVNLIKDKQKIISKLYMNLLSTVTITGNLLRENLVRTHKNSNAYLIILIASAVFFFFIGFIL